MQPATGQPNSLRWYRKIAYGAGNFLTVLAISMWFPYGLSFFQNVLLLPNGSSSGATIILIAQVGGAVSTPFIGMWVDQCRCRFPGRRKIFHLVGVVLISCSFFFIWHDCFGCTTAPAPYKVLYYSSFAIVFQFAWACIQISQLSFIPQLTSDKNEQVELNSIRYAFTIIANILIFGCFWGLLEHINNGDTDANDLNQNDKKIFWIMALVVLMVGIPVTLMFQIFIPEKSDDVSQRQKWYKWFCNPKFYLTALCLVAARFIVLLPQTFMPSYFLTTLSMDKTSIAKGPLILFISSFFGTLVVKKISKKVGDKMTYFLGLAVVWAALIWFWVKAPQSSDGTGHCDFNFRRDEIYGATILLGAGGAAVLVISLSKISHLVGDYAGSSGFVYGWMLFLDRLTNGLAVKIILSFQPKELYKLPDFHRRVLIFPPFAGSALGLLVITLMFVIDWRQQRRTHGNEGDRDGNDGEREVLIVQDKRRLEITASASYGSNAIGDGGTVNTRPSDHRYRHYITT